MKKEYKIVKEDIKVTYLMCKKLCKERGIPYQKEIEIFDHYIDSTYLKWADKVIKEAKCKDSLDWDIINNFKKDTIQWRNEFEKEYQKNKFKFLLSVELIKIKKFFRRKKVRVGS